MGSLDLKKIAEFNLTPRRVLRTIKEICNWLDISEKEFYNLLKAGMPAKKFSGRWYSHIDTLEEWFREEIKRGGQR